MTQTTISYLNGCTESCEPSSLFSSPFPTLGAAAATGKAVVPAVVVAVGTQPAKAKGSKKKGCPARRFKPRVRKKIGKLPPPVIGKLRLEDLHVKAGPVSDAARKTTAITYDAQGGLIPLSRRFDASSDDVLYQMDAGAVGETLEQHKRLERIVSWIKPEVLNSAAGKSREEIFEMFGNELEPVARIPDKYLGAFEGFSEDGLVYTGMGYFVDHVVNHHASDIPPEAYLRIQEIIDSNDEVIKDTRKGRDSLIFVKKIDGNYLLVVSMDKGDDGKIHLYKSLSKTEKKKPYPKLDRVSVNGTSPKELPRYTRDPKESRGGSRFSALDRFSLANPEIADRSFDLRAQMPEETWAPDGELIAKAKGNFGTTTNLDEAFYLLPDGTMLDGSGRHWGGAEQEVAGRRQVDHADVSEVIDGPDGAEAVYAFMARTGAIRMDRIVGIASAAHPPTAAQLSVLGRAYTGRRLAVSYLTPDGSRVVTDAEFDAASPRKIEDFFREGPERLSRGEIDGQYAQIAYHGSPYIFGKFTLDHIGEGEGAQVHGWGLYFAHDQEVAEGYKDKLAGPDNVTIAGIPVDIGYAAESELWEDDLSDPGRYARLEIAAQLNEIANGFGSGFELDGGPVDPKVAKQAVEAVADWERWKLDQMRQDLEDKRAEYEEARASGEEVDEDIEREDLGFLEDQVRVHEAVLAVVEAWVRDGVEISQPEGRLYEVDIPEDHEMLREDAALSAQPDAVRDAVAKVFEELGPEPRSGGATGKEIYGAAATVAGSPKAASELFARHGILGMRYNGRRDGECAVVWSEEAVQIREILEQQLEPGEGGVAPAAPGPRGYFNTKSFTTTLTTSADLSTFAHETGHWYLETIMSLVRDGFGDESLKGDVKVLCETFGIQSAEEFFQMAPEKKRIVHERFAAWVEEYLGTGKAPDPSLAGVFQRFADWIIGVYQDVFLHNALPRRHEALFGEKLPELSDEVRGVLDRMVGAQRQQEQFEATFGAQPLFGEKPDWVSEEEWEDYAQAQAARTQEGRETLMSRNLATMKWAKRAHSRVLRWMQKEADAKRAAIRDPRSARP